DDPDRRHAVAAAGSGNTIQASDDEFESYLSPATTSVDLTIGRRVPRGTIPGGEAEVVPPGGGGYVSGIGRNALFHNLEDRGTKPVDLGVIARFTKAVAVLGEMLVAK